MNLPADYLELVDDGVAALRELAGQLRVRAVVKPDAPELWLSIRDYEGLAGRLAASDERYWRDGSASILISGQDLGVLDELLARDDGSPILASEEQVAALARLRQFLRRYCDREFKTN